MSTDCQHNIDDLKLLRPGITQDLRYLAALDPANNPVDAHGVAQKIVFARELAEWIHYYNRENAVDGDWSAFFSQDVSVPLAIISIQDLDTYKKHIQSLFTILNTAGLTVNEYKSAIGELFSLVGSLAVQLDDLLQTLSEELDVKQILRTLIRQKLAGSFAQLKKQYQFGSTNNLVDIIVPELDILHQKSMSMENALMVTLSPDWNATVPVINLYGTGSTFDKLNFLANHQLFKNIFDDFLRAFARIVEAGKKTLELTLSKFDQHSPHYALFLSFIKLLEIAREQTNRITGRHLDFYYRDILQLKERDAKPSEVHVLAELTRQATTHEISKGTRFNAGKDALKKEAFYANTHSTVINQAKVTDRKTVYRHTPELQEFEAGVIHDGRIFASAIANSDDGIKPELTSPDHSWHPFFNKKYKHDPLVRIDMPMASIGFAIASHYLLLAEGKRTISITLNLSFIDLATELPLDAFTFYLTTEKEWLEIKQYECIRIDQHVTSYTLVLTLSGNDPAITPYVAKTHGYQLQTDLPVLMVRLRQERTTPYFYNTLASAVIASISLKVSVERMKTLAISNDFGPVDASKPFQPFGATPVKGQSLVIGSKEVFQKKLDSIKLHFKWQQRTRPYGADDKDRFYFPYVVDLAALVEPGFMTRMVLGPFEDQGRAIHVQSSFLNNSQWTGHGPGHTLYDPEYAITEPLENFIRDHPDSTENEFYATDARLGFMQLSLESGFGHNQYLNDLTVFLKKGGTNPGSVPVGPTLESLALDYTATQEIPLAPGDTYSKAAFFHLAPFGEPRQDPADPHLKTISLFPRFDFTRDDIPFESEAEFYIGIEGLLPPQTLSLLFQVVDGTAHPLVEKPDPHIQWSFLSHNHWINFRDNEIDDKTSGLLQSGIISFSVPRAASHQNTLLPANKYWIRAAVHNNSHAICRLIDVHAQAMHASFADEGNDPVFGAQPLAPGTISKLKFPNADVKKIEQPYSSFGGRIRESASAFYTRISERLRHKDRAVALWDYEHLILEQFPAIHRVKCLNHTEYEPSPTGVLIYKELAPGHVTITTIPAHRTRHSPMPLKPFTSLGLLKEIEAFIQKRVSCFVKLHVRNPLFEEVRVVANVRLKDGIDELFYIEKLQQAITRFLSPWAFSDEETPTFGGKIYKSSLINFVEEQSYVDYVTDFQVYVDIQGVQGTTDLNVVEGSTAVSALVSVPAEKHQLTVISPVDALGLHEKCMCTS